MIDYFKAIKIIFNNINKHIIKLNDEKIQTLNSSNNLIFNSIHAKQNIPSFINSAMDGYAVKCTETLDVNEYNKKKFLVIGELQAGKYINYKNVDKNCAIQIMTGARVPKCFDSIIKIEDIYIKKKTHIIIDKPSIKNQNIRLIGQDFKKHNIIINKCDKLNCHNIMTLSSFGINKINIIKKPKFFLLSTGCELVSSNENIDKKYLIYNSSAPYIISFLQNLSIMINYLGTSKDNLDEFLNKIKIILSTNYFSTFITTGAVSKGNFDFIPIILKKIGIKILFHKVNIKPGKPILFARYKKHIYFFCLPGNPISSLIGLRFFIYPFIKFFLKQDLEQPLKAKLINKSLQKFKKHTFLKGYIFTRKSSIYVKILKHQESFKTNSLIKCNCFVFFKKNDIIKKNTLTNTYIYQPFIS